MLGENISKDVSRRVWSIVDVRDKELVAKVIRLGIKPNESTVWRYLATKGAYPKRAADDATLLEMLGAGEFEPSMLCDQYAISVYLARPQLMQDLVDAHVLYADYRDRVILQLSTCHMYQRDFATHLQKIDEFRAAGGAVTGRCILSACQSSGPDDFISGLVDRMGDALKTEDVITSLVSEVQPYPVAARATRLLLPRSFPVSLHALEVAIPIVWGNGRPEDRVDVLRDLLAHANVADLAAQDGIRKLGDSLVTKAMTSARFDLIGEANRTRLIELLVAAGFIVKEQDVAVALSKGWEQVSGALLQSVHKEGVSAVDIS
ncbi:hypothetical protein HK101_005132 [Irineochytrium annulatum]|nr:hypothetical protein HK101_005132 [Irineochytrium annulatum]